MLRISVKLGSNHASHKLSLNYGHDFMLRISVISGLTHLGLIFGSNHASKFKNLLPVEICNKRFLFCRTGIYWNLSQFYRLMIFFVRFETLKKSFRL